MLRVYVASSWRNEHQQAVVAAVREAGYLAYDFRVPVPGNNGFHWREIDPHWKDWTVPEYRKAMLHPIAERGYGLDMDALLACDVCVLVLPSGRSAHAEAGFACGKGKLVYVYSPEPHEPELVYKMFDGITDKLSDIVLACRVAAARFREVVWPASESYR